MQIKQCECGCGEIAEKRKNAPVGSYRRFNDGHAGKSGDRYKAQKAIGKPIPKGAEVHHHGALINGGNGRFKDTRQLVLCENHEYHCFLHMRQRDYFGVSVFRYGK